MDNSDKIKTKMSMKANEVESLILETTLMEWPEDIGKLIESWRLEAKKIPDELEHKKRILFRLDMAEGSLNSGRDQAYKISLLCAQKYFKDAKHAEHLLGVSKQLLTAGKQRGQDQTAERKPHWEMWSNLATEIQAESTIKLSKIELARKVKKKLSLPDSIETIRRRIKVFW
jgi:hypothetical protein